MTKSTEEVEKEIKRLGTEIEKEKDPETRDTLSMERKKNIEQLKEINQERKQIESKLELYEHVEKADQVFLDVGIGLRLSNDQVIEIARIGPRWDSD